MERSTQKFTNKTASSLSTKLKNNQRSTNKGEVCYAFCLQDWNSLDTYVHVEVKWMDLNEVIEFQTSPMTKMNTEWTPPAAGLSTSDMWFEDKPLNSSETQFPPVRTQMMIIISAITQNLFLKWNLIILVQTVCSIIMKIKIEVKISYFVF